MKGYLDNTSTGGKVLFPINEDTQRDQFNAILGGEVVALPNTYLGLSVGEKFNSKEIGYSVSEKSVFVSNPSRVIKRLDSIRRAFL